MSGFDEKALLEILSGTLNPRPNVWIETGTYKGQRTRMARRHFQSLHTIEINPQLWAEAYNPMVDIGVVPHLGDSADLLRRLLEIIQQPILFFLDAHWGPNEGMDYGDNEEFPLWDELEAIREHRQHDIVVVDDVHAFGTESPTWLWQTVTVENIQREIECQRPGIILGDQAVFYL